MSEKSSEEQFATQVVIKLRAAGYEALYAGGCVRDQLLGITPKDYDVATNATPAQVRQLFGKKRTIAVGVSFGVVAVIGNRSEGNVEIATFRQDAGYSDGRHPDSVQFSNAEEDAKRRDFTINGLFFDPIEEQVIDYVGGQEDLRGKVIRAIGNAEDRIAEDKLRMLRAVRFAATYDFELEAKTKAAVQANAHSIHVVSQERIAAELRKMLAHRNRAQALTYLAQCKLAQPVLDAPDLLDLNQIESAIRLLAQLRTEKFETAFAGLIFSLLKNRSLSRQLNRQLSKLFNRWKLSNDESEKVVWLVNSLPVVLNASEETWPQVQRVLIGAEVSELLGLAQAISSLRQNQLQSNIDYCQQQLSLPPERLNPTPLIDGNALRAAGLQPGPEFKRILDEIRDRQLRGEIATTAAALDLATQLASSAS